jgi:hypothetical protein
MSRNTEVEREAPEEQTATYERENSNTEDTVKNATEQRNLGTLAYKIKCKWGNQAKKAEMKLRGEQE